MSTLMLDEDTFCLLVENDRIRELLPFVAVHPKDVIDRAQEEGCQDCAGRRKATKNGRQKQLTAIVQRVAAKLAESDKVSQVKEILQVDNLVVYADGQRTVL